MENHRRYLFIALGFGLGLTLALLCIVGSKPSSATAAPVAELQVCSSGCTYSSIQAAVDAANENDIIKVASGVYTDVNNYGGLAQIIYVSKTVTIRGGYTTTDSFADPPNPSANPVILDAELLGRGIYVAGNISPTIEGLQITNGDADGLGGTKWGQDVGGGVYIVSATVTFSGNHVLNSTAYHGGGMYLWNSASILAGNTIATNTVSSHYTRHGGGLYLYESPATLVSNTILGNTGGEGGGIFLSYSDATLSQNTISDNTSGSGAGGVFVYMSDAELTDNVIANNRASDSGGGLFLNHSEAILRNNTISSNTAYSWGGGLYLGSGTPQLVENSIVSNTVTDGYGGGVCAYSSHAVLIRNDVSFNVGRDGGGLYLHNGSAPALDGNIVTFNTAVKGGGIYLEAGVTLTNTVVAGNQASDKGSGLYVATSSSRLLQTTVARHLVGDGIGVYAVGNVYMENTIVASNTVGIFVSTDEEATLEATLWGSDEWANGDNWSGAGSVSLGAISIEGDPCFANPDEGDYHICSSSAARDAGVNTGVTEDIDSDARPDGNAYDIGADEFQLSAVGDLQVVSVITNATTLTATLTWSKPSNVTTYTLRYSSSLVTDANWVLATVLTDSLTDTANMYTAVVPYSGGNVYFALKYWTACGEESSVSTNAFWPSKKVYLPLVLRNAP